MAPHFFILQDLIMAVIIKNGKYNREQLEIEINMLKALVTDLERIINGEHPDERQLSNSPAITSWKLSKRPTTCLEGVLFEHPRLGFIVPNGITSELWLLDLDRNYARTFSRFYRLGQKDIGN
ncbi:hypothetical protein F9K91_22495 [Brucella tritici]|uniref:Uncharacterized protein n=2 Tax=Brucella tritici TaxID=94626 RepID=A0A833CJG5_9HYPH|nr:hypothetical protein F9K91_22495 [Brucella tritici]KAB2697706.1 hypothetical protein F9K79_16675 [Ochrobactrum sp. Kaboul]